MPMILCSNFSLLRNLKSLEDDNTALTENLQYLTQTFGDRPSSGEPAWQQPPDLQVLWAGTYVFTSSRSAIRRVDRIYFAEVRPVPNNYFFTVRHPIMIYPA